MSAAWATGSEGEELLATSPELARRAASVASRARANVILGSAMGIVLVGLGIYLDLQSSPLAFLSVAFGAFLFAFSLVVYRLIRRGQARRFTSLRLVPAGLVGTERSGAQRRGDWSDAGVALELTAYRAPGMDTDALRSLKWLGGRRPDSYMITETGFDHLIEQARARGLVVTQATAQKGLLAETKVSIHRSPAS